MKITQFLTIYEGPPLQGLFEARRGRCGLKETVVEAAAGRPSGRRHNLVCGGVGAAAPAFNPGNAFIVGNHGKNLTLPGAHESR